MNNNSFLKIKCVLYRIKMNIGIVIDYSKKSGGAEHFVLAEIDIIESLRKKRKENFVYIATSKEIYIELKKKNLPTLLFEKNNFLNRLSFILNIFSFLRKIVFKLKLNSFENFLKKKEINFLYFLSPTKLVFFCRRIDFVSTVWEIQYKFFPNLLEYKNIFYDLQDRDDISKFISLFAYRIFVGTLQSKNDFIRFYNCDSSRIIEKLTQSNIVNKFLDLGIENPKNNIGEYFFYPAQFWSHKNHIYIVEAFREIKKEKINLKCVFAGSDKGFLNTIKNKIQEYELQDYFIIKDYLSDEDIIKFYLNCKAVVVPSVVGTFSFPHIEGFFFKKIVFSSIKNLDKNFSERVIELDLSDPKSLLRSYERTLKNEDQIAKLVENNRKFYEDRLSKRINIDIYSDIIDNYLSDIKR